MSAVPLFDQNISLQAVHDYLESLLARKMQTYYVSFGKHRKVNGIEDYTAMIVYTDKLGNKSNFSVSGTSFADLFRQVGERLPK